MHTKTGVESEISVCSKIMYRKNSANINELINRFELNDDFVADNVKFVKVGKEKEKFFAFRGPEMDRSMMKFQNNEDYPKKRGRSWSARKITQQKIANVLSVIICLIFYSNLNQLSVINIKYLNTISNLLRIDVSFIYLKLDDLKAKNEC